ncbi:unnamed protein product [Arabidopsis thaliana]|uniref:(thale cress) hypothetical protein n=1 Tax=Arabidopsis thaliana TaxID=3702 RepID=A0A7G2FN92_ARATH|nr:unnamed protein product [Arabidopsis thaliana]
MITSLRMSTLHSPPTSHFHEELLTVSRKLQEKTIVVSKDIEMWKFDCNLPD